MKVMYNKTKMILRRDKEVKIKLYKLLIKQTSIVHLKKHYLIFLPLSLR